MFISDQNMLNEIELLKSSGKVKSKQEVYEVIGLDRTRINNIRNQERYNRAYHFSAENIRLFCKKYKIDANKILGLK